MFFRYRTFRYFIRAILPVIIILNDSSSVIAWTKTRVIITSSIIYSAASEDREQTFSFINALHLSEEKKFVIAVSC